MHAFPHASSMVSLDGRLVQVEAHGGDRSKDVTSPQPSPTMTSGQERRFVCLAPGCGKRFNRKFTLKEHTKTHTGARPYACDYDGCMASFSTSGNLSRHKFTHTGEKPFGCSFELCYKRFCTKEKLARHTKTHSGIRPFTCKVDGCSKRFSTSGNLGRHLKTHRDLHDDSSSPKPDSSSWPAVAHGLAAHPPSPSTSSSRSSYSSASSTSAFDGLSSAAIDEHIISVLRYDAKMALAAAKPPSFRAPAVSLQRSHSDFVQNRPHHHGHHQHLAPQQQNTHPQLPPQLHQSSPHFQYHQHPHQPPLQIAIPTYTAPTSAGRLTFNMVDSPPAQWHTHLEHTFPTKLPSHQTTPSSIPEYEPLPFDINGATAQPKLGRSVSEGAFFNLWL
ncbi:hypothetical protein DYB37_007420 [Aphanomyces astaci]|uniref:C2H2-type domain-containing protein n=1 Tax=Aphanomyces astaci TaxID=112090 RepID=A0A418FEB8_APHAT|nr:hypothetical protein DYB37_007420 [Aphanomyces astaci]